MKPGVKKNEGIVLIAGGMNRVSIFHGIIVLIVIKGKKMTKTVNFYKK